MKQQQLSNSSLLPAGLLLYIAIAGRPTLDRNQHCFGEIMEKNSKLYSQEEEDEGDNSILSHDLSLLFGERYFKPGNFKKGRLNFKILVSRK